MPNLLTATAAGAQSYIGSLLLPVVFLVIFYFILIRPQKKKEKQVKEMRSALKTGDKVITIGGINGKITKIMEDKVTLEIGDQGRLVVEKWAIGSLQKTSLDK